ncbi:MAG: hypothetical protein HY670_00015 [Chloroflexi bacterium]|nr:hypothetical protein [Chloroflexota bacterium]
MNNQNTAQAIFQLANPVFVAAAIVVPSGALIYAMNFGSLTFLNYVHILTGGLWTGIDLFMGFVLGPVLGRMEPKDRAGLFRRLTPRMTFLMPVLAGVTITSGLDLAQKLGMTLFANPWLIAALVIVGILSIQGFGVLLPNEVRIFRQLLAAQPDINKIARLGMITARMGGVQGVFQLAIIFIMANIRF